MLISIALILISGLLPTDNVYLKDDLKLSFGFADKYLTAIKLSKEDAKLLNLNENDPAIMINDNIHLSNGLLFNTSNIIYNYQTTNFYSVAQ